MNLYIENKSPSFVKKAFETVVENTKKTVFKGVAVNRKTRFDSRTYRFFRKRMVYDIEYVIFHSRALRRGIRFLNKEKKAIGLTYVIDKPLTEKEKRLLGKARRPIKIVDETADAENLRFYQDSKYILHRACGEDKIRDVDIMHLSKFEETLYGCRFSSCLGQYLYVDGAGNVYFCPEHKAESYVGTIDVPENYFQSEKILSVLRNAVEKRKSCKESCPHFSLCNGACPLEEGCCDFPMRYETYGNRIDRLAQERTDLSTLHFSEGMILLKDIAYGECE